MRIGITYNLKRDGGLDPRLPDDYQEEYDSPVTISAIEEVLVGLGHEVLRLGDGEPMLRKLLGLGPQPDFIFNIAEGEGTSRSREARVPAVLEMLGIPYSGSDPLTLAVTLDKDCAKRIVSTAGVAVPPSELRMPGDANSKLKTPNSKLRYPVIVKPCWEGSSKGVRNKCFVERPEQLDVLVDEMLHDYRQPILVEEYIQGAELTVGILGNDPPRILGMTHVLPLQNQERFIYSLEVKRDWEDRVRYDYDPKLSAEVRAEVERSALACYQVLGCRDVARIDFRVRGGVPYFLEANPLPGLRPEYSDLALLANARGMSYAELLRAILDAAIARYPDLRNP